MKFVFVDEENIGFKELESIDFSVLDKVFVFSNNSVVKDLCEKRLYLSVSGYPQGSNQADFYIISYLSKVISTISFEEKELLELVLYTKDKSLITAFEYQCKLVNMSCNFPMNEVITKPVSNCSVEDMILSSLNKPRSSNEIMNLLNLQLSDFTSPINSLINDGKIIRNPLDKKQWVLSPKA